MRKLIESSRQRVAGAVNAETSGLYWNIGRHIHQFLFINGRAEYGKGFSERSLARMIKFYEYFPDESILPTLLAKLS